MERHDPLLPILKRGYRRFQVRRIVEAVALGASVFAPVALGALALGLLVATSRIGSWLVPILFAAGFVAAVVRSIRFGLRHRMGFGAFLLSVEERAGLRRNELFNALQLGRRASSMADPLAREVAREVLRRGCATARQIPFGALAPARALRGPLGQASGAAVLVLVLGLLAPEEVLRTADQLLHPGRVPQPADVAILVEPGDTTAQRGASLPVRARLVGIDGEPVLFHRAGGGVWQRMVMVPEADRFTATLADLQAETEYAVSVGGHRSPTFRVALEEPLRATGYEKRTRFPSYSGLAPEKELSPHASIAALTGSEVELLVGVSRPDATGRLVFESGPVLSLQRAGESVLTASVGVLTPDRFHVELESPSLPRGGWRSEAFHVDPIPDAMPGIYLLAPGEQIDLPPEMRVVLEIDCVDDFGITRLDLSWRRNDEPPSQTTITRWTGESEARVLYPWNLEEIAMAPGDRIVYRLELTDNDAVSGPKTAVSPDYIIRFPGIEEMYAQQEQERREGIEDLRESLEKQVELREQLDRIAQDLRQDRSMEWEQKQEVEEFLQQQEEILEKMEQLASAMDRQLDRMQQGELFSPEIIEKIAKIRELVQQIQSPEFHRQMERLREALSSLDPKEVRKALEEMKLTQKELQQGLDRTIQMLERLMAEEKLDELIRQAERLLEQQERINEDASRTPGAQEADSTSALTPEAAEALRRQQEEARRQLDELRKQMEELKDLASRSHQEMSRELEGEEGEQSEESLEEASQEMQASEAAMSGRNRKGARSSGKKASAKIQSFAQQMREMQAEIESDRTRELSRRILALAGNLVDLSKRQEALTENVNAQNTRDLAVGEDRLGRAAGHVVDQIYELARETPFITPAQARALGELLNALSSATDAFETGRRPNGAALGRSAGSMMDEIVAGLLESNESMCNNASASCNKPNPSAAMQGLTSQQRGVNQGTQELMGEMQGERLQQQGTGRLEQLAAQQERIREGLREVAGSLGDRRDVLGRLDDLGKEMEEVVEQMRDRNVDERILRRQERILSRLLTAQRSLRRQDFEEQRRSRTGIDPGDRTGPGPVTEGLSYHERIRRGILKGSQDPIPADFRRIVDAYFRALMEGNR